MMMKASLRQDPLILDILALVAMDLRPRSSKRTHGYRTPHTACLSRYIGAILYPRPPVKFMSYPRSLLHIT